MQPRVVLRSFTLAPYPTQLLIIYDLNISVSSKSYINRQRSFGSYWDTPPPPLIHNLKGAIYVAQPAMHKDCYFCYSLCDQTPALDILPVKSFIVVRICDV